MLRQSTCRGLDGELQDLTEAIGCFLFHVRRIFTDFIEVPVDVAFLSNVNTVSNDLHQVNPKLFQLITVEINKVDKVLLNYCIFYN